MTHKGSPSVFAYKYDSPLGPITLQSDGRRLTVLDFGIMEHTNFTTLDIFKETASQLDEYFAGARKEFTIPLHTQGTAFQQKVWDALLTIEYGKTCSYEDIAHKVGSPKACRAVGMANNRNSIAILIPCHRVIGKSGSLVGYGGGLDIKVALLKLEQRYK